MVGGIFLFYFGVTYGRGSHAQSCEWCACDECEEYHESDHIPEEAEAEPYEGDELEVEDDEREDKVVDSKSVSVSVEDLLKSLDVASHVLTEANDTGLEQSVRKIKRVRRLLRRLDPDEVKALM